MNASESNEGLDLSSFPLLRIDEIRRHSTDTLHKSEKQLVELQQTDEAIQSMPFVSKLLGHIKKELSERIGGEDKKSGNRAKSRLDCGLTPHKKISPKKLKGQHRPSSTPVRKNANNPSTPSFFVPSSSSESASFQSRSKLAKASIQARSQDAIDRQSEEIRKDRTRKALETMQEWRAEREQSKKRREELLEEEKRAARIRRLERRRHEQRVKNSMRNAAEEAKSFALQSGSSPEEAILEAAAAAAQVVDDQSIVFHDDVDDSDSDCSTIGIGDDGKSSPNNDVETSTLNVQHEHTETESYSSTSTETTSQDNPRNFEEASERSIHSNCDNSSHEDLELYTDKPDRDDRLSPNSIEVDASPAVTLAISTCEVSNDETPAQFEEVHESATVSVPISVPCEEPSSHKAVEFAGSHKCEEEIITPKASSPPKQLATLEPSRHHVDTDSSSTTPNDDYSKTYEGIASRSQIQQHNRFTHHIPSFFHIFSQFSTGSRSKGDEKELLRCMKVQIERCFNVEVDTDPHNNVEPNLFYRIKSNRPEVVDIISKCFLERSMCQWEEAPDRGLWNLMWTWGMPKAADFEDLLVFQKVSRFRNTRGLTRKDLLKKNIQRCIGISDRASRDSFNIMPLTYALPHEFSAFVKGFASIQNASRNKRNNIWIIKPIGLSRGRGISLVDSVSDVSYSQPIVIQKYIESPFCFMDYKFDLRVYVLVTSFAPLEAFIYKEGLARFGTRKYSASSQNIHDLRIHLTNSSIQHEFGQDIDKDHPAYLAGSCGAASKVAMTWLWRRLDELGMDTNQLWNRIVDVCIKALVAGGSDIPWQPNSFELFGFDVIFDESLKCWLIEVNSSPSMSCDSSLDKRIKRNLINDTVALVDPAQIDQRALVDIFSRRLSHRKEASNRSSASILEQDLEKILNHKLPRKYGIMPKKLGGYQRIAPVTDTYNQLCG